jgi:hypothetical protein
LNLAELPFIQSRLRPHQQAPFEQMRRILSQRCAALDESDTGVGKSYLASAFAHLYDEPTLIVGPKIAENTWLRAAKHFNDKFSYVGYEKLRAGNTPYGKWSNSDRRREKFFQCTNCLCKFDPEYIDDWFPCPHHSAGIHCFDSKSKRADYGDFKFDPAVRCVVFDEAHRGNGWHSINAEIIIAARRQNIKTLALSATPAVTPLQMRALGYLLDLHNDNTDLLSSRTRAPGRLLCPSFKRWLSPLGCRYSAEFHGYHWFSSPECQQQIMDSIRADIIPSRGIRIRREDIAGFPECDIRAELYTLDDPRAVDSCYMEMAGALAQVAARRAGDKCPELAITDGMRQRQEVELLKVPVFEELANDYLTQGYSVVFFVNFRQTIEELLKRFPWAGVIDGQTKNRDQYVDKFQENSLRVLICNSEAGGINLSLQDLDGRHPRAGLVSANFSAVSLLQVLGRLPRDGGRSRSLYRIIFAAETIEEDVYEKVNPKLANLGALLDSDLLPNLLKIRP